MGQAVALHSGQDWRRFWRRWAQVAGCALLVSIGSSLMFPRSWISFGVLHGIAVMLVLVRLGGRLGAWWWPLGLLLVLLPQWIQHPFFDTRWTNWVGLVTRKPSTEDYVPLLPWLGVMGWGLAAGQWLLRLVVEIFESVRCQVAWQQPENDDFVCLGDFGNHFGKISRRPCPNHVL